MLTCKDIPMRPNSLHRAKRITSICAICINVHIELTSTSFLQISFHDTVNLLPGAGDQRKTCAIRAWWKQKTVTFKQAWNLAHFSFS